MPSTAMMGALIGLLLGAVLVFDDFGGMLTCALFAAVGWVVVRVAAGELDLTRYLGGRARGGRGPQ